MNTASRKTILFFPRWYPIPEDEMFGLFIRYHAEILAAKYKVVILYAHPVHHDHLKGISHTEEAGLIVYRNYFRVRPKGINRIFNPFRFLIASWQLWQRAKKEGITPDLCHVHVLTRTALLPYFLKLTQGIPFIITEHWSRYLAQNRQTAYKSIFRKQLTTFLSQQAFALTSVTQALLIAMEECGITNKRKWVIPNVVDTNRFCLGKKSATIPTLLHVGCFDEKAKNIKGLLRTARKLTDSGNKFHLKLVGTGEDWQMCVDYAQGIGLDHSVVSFTGLLMGQELVDAYQECTALVLFSHYETQGVVLLEAFACGKPVVASNVGGIPEVVSLERGILVEAGNEDELLKALEKVVNGTIDFGSPEDLRNYALENFSSNAIVQQFSELYDQAWSK